VDTFLALRELLGRHSKRLIVAADGPDQFALEAPIGPATVTAWRGQRRRETIPVAWAQRRKSHVNYHLMGLNNNAPLVASLSPPLKARLHGKTCFRFRPADIVPGDELAAVTLRSIESLQRHGFIRERGQEQK
jgi:hypothetical protein